MFNYLNHPAIQETKETKVCTCCGKEKPIEEFFKNRYGYSSHCKECVSSNMKKGHMGEGKRSTPQRRRIADLEKQLEDAKKVSLDNYSPRELFIHLKELGYKWEKMTYTKVEEVDWNKI